MVGAIIFGGIQAALLGLLAFGGIALPIIDRVRDRRLIHMSGARR